MLRRVRDRNDRGDRRPWQPWFDLHPPEDDQLAQVVAALDAVLTEAGFERRSAFGVRPIENEADRLHIRAAWERWPLTDRRDQYVPTLEGWVTSGDGASVWGSGLIRVDADGQSVELMSRGAKPETLAAMVAALLARADAPYR